MRVWWCVLSVFRCLSWISVRVVLRLVRLYLKLGLIIFVCGLCLWFRWL